MFNEEFYQLENGDGEKRSTAPKMSGGGGGTAGAGSSNYADDLVMVSNHKGAGVSSSSRGASHDDDGDDDEAAGGAGPKGDPKDQKFRCRFCGLEYSYMTTLKAHERVHDVEEPYVCPSCGMSFRYYSELQGHALQHRSTSGEKVYKCMCNRTFTKYTDLLYHKHADEVEEPEFKETLAAGGNEPAYLWKYPDRRKTYYCEFCLKAYASAHDLKYHIYSHRGERQFTVGASRYWMKRTN